MNSPTLEEIERDLTRMAHSGAPDLEAAITYLAGELSERKPEERLPLLEELSHRFAEPRDCEAAASREGGAGEEEMTRLVLQFLGRSPAGEGSGPESRSRRRSSSSATRRGMRAGAGGWSRGSAGNRCCGSSRKTAGRSSRGGDQMPILPRIIVLLLFVLLASSCSSSGKKAVQMQPLERAQAESPRAEDLVEAVEWQRPDRETSAASQSYRKEGVTLQIQADPQLNRYQRNAHTLFLCLYQLKDPNGFVQLAQERDGLQKLLQCGRFDGSVANARQYVIQPGQRLTELRDRSEGSRYLGVATGYFGSGEEKVTDLANLSPGGEGATSISIELGPHEITSVKVK